MNNFGLSRLRRYVVATAVVGLGAGLLPLSAALAAPGTPAVAAHASVGTTGLSGLMMTRGSVRVGGELWDGVIVSPRAARVVTVQYRRAGTVAFKNASTVTASAQGVLTLCLRPPGAGSWQFRAVVASTSRAARFVSSTRTVVASGHASPTSISGFATTGATVTPGATVTDDVVISPRATRVVSVQARRPGTTTFLTQSSGTSTRTGDFRAAYRLTSPGVWGFRLVVRATATAGPATSPTRIIIAAENPGSDRTPPGPVTAMTISGLTDTTATLSWTNPTDVDLTGAVIRRAPGDTAPATVTDGTAVTDLAVPATSFTDTGLSPDTAYSYAVFAHDATPNYAAATDLSLRTAVGPDHSAPAPVTDLVATATDTTVALSWTNPTDADLTGAVIRRALGDSAPATITDGTAVTDLTTPATSFTDTTLDPDTTYSYAVFAHDATPNYADPTQLTVTTHARVTTAVLTIRPLGLPLNQANKLTANTPFRFDATNSHPAAGTTLVSGTVDFGDGQTETFAEAFGPIDFWNTEHTYTTTGPQTVKLTVTDSTGTTDTTTLTVNVLPEPTATLTVTSGPIQTGAPVTFTLNATTPAGTELNNYFLNFTGNDYFHLTANTPPPATQTVTFTIPGTYNVALSVANDAGGYTANQITIVVP
jgi:PKD domain/Fibronectin type III domain